MNRFDATVLGALDVANTEVLKRRHTELTPFHLLWGLASHPQAQSARLLAQAKPEIDRRLAALPAASKPVGLDTVRPTSKLNEWLTLASGRAVEAGRSEVGELDLLYFLPKITPEIRLSEAPVEQDAEVPAFLTNLNELADNGKLDPVIGRSKEIRAVMEILGRRNKNNPVLVGPAGVGKTAIVEGLAEQIVKGKVPDVLLGKIVYALDMGALMSGTKYRGEFEERIQKLLQFIKANAGKAILFIDELHQIVGAGRTDGAMDAANLLKPALARGDLHCIGATTPDEYQKYILADSALDRRFRPVRVDEPSIEDAVEIIMGIREKQEMHHGIKISDAAVYSSVLLSTQYLTDKNLPDKAIDLIDEAASALKLSAEAMPAELVQLEADIRAKRVYAKFEKDDPRVIEEIEALQKKFTEGRALWEKDVAVLRKLSSTRNAIDRLKFDLDKAEREGNFEEASRIKYGTLPDLERQLDEMQHTWILKDSHIANIVARQTGIPIEKVLQDRQERILELEPYLQGRVFGQAEALREISETLITAHSGISDETKPLGSFLLMGPTGVGKTETAKGISEFLFGTERNMVRLDMSEYSEKHAVAKLIGAPAGYVGYDEGGILTEAIRRKPYSVILFDEIEKAHPDFADILLQILDDGRLTDNKGRTVNFRNTIIFLTTNSRDIRRDFKPEVLGRLDAMVHYKPLDASIMRRLVEKQLELLQERLRSKKSSVRLSEDLVQSLCAQGYEPEYGARPLAATFQRLVNRPLARQIVGGHLSAGDTVHMGWKDGQTTLEVVRAANG